MYHHYPKWKNWAESLCRNPKINWNFTKATIYVQSQSCSRATMGRCSRATHWKTVLTGSMRIALSVQHQNIVLEHYIWTEQLKNIDIHDNVALRQHRVGHVFIAIRCNNYVNLGTVWSIIAWALMQDRNTSEWSWSCCSMATSGDTFYHLTADYPKRPQNLLNFEDIEYLLKDRPAT